MHALNKNKSDVTVSRVHQKRKRADTGRKQPNQLPPESARSAAELPYASNILLPRSHFDTKFRLDIVS